MTRLSPAQRMQVIAIYNDLNDLRVRNKCKRVSEIAKQSGIDISKEGVRLILKKWKDSSKIFILI